VQIEDGWLSIDLVKGLDKLHINAKKTSVMAILLIDFFGHVAMEGSKVACRPTPDI
jgi:hypothetical protein